jgi:glycosyltransferase involved in cell wall biosynthesis/tetratricopeptide (TPR) repeat protein
MTGPQRDLGTQSTQPLLASWLSRNWLSDGPSVCVVEGFSGLGKSHLARQVRDGYPHESAYVEMADTHTSFEDFLLKTQGRLKIEADIGIPVGADTAHSIDRALRGNLLVVVDDFQNCLAPGTHELTRQFADFFHQLRSRRAGRLLLVTTQSIDENQCHELGIVQRTLVPLPPEEGGALLSRMLAARDRLDEVPAERTVELAQWLGSNPRAMQALVAALRFAPLAELVGTEPDAAEIGYRYVDELLVADLERQFVQRTMDRLTEPELLLLKRLSVHRNSFSREAITFAHTDIDGDLRRAIVELIAHFFLEHHRSEYRLNPTARELALRSVLRDHRATKTAHRHAADFYLRHFKAKKIQTTALADKFMEARHHLHLAGRITEVRDLAQTFALHLQRSAMTQPFPEEPEELDEQILLLDAALEQGSPSSLLNLRLARLLLQRGRDGDAARALTETTSAIAIPPLSKRVWQLHLQLVYQAHGLDAVIPLIDQARAELPPRDHAAILLEYVRLLRKSTRYTEALTIVLDTIATEADASRGREHLYIEAIDLLVRTGAPDRAEKVIDAAFTEYSATTPVDASATLYDTCVKFYWSHGNRAAATALLDDALNHLTRTPDLAMLFQTGINLHVEDGNHTEARALLAAGMARLPAGQRDFRLFHAGVMLHARLGEVPQAVELLEQAMATLPLRSTMSLLNSVILLHVRHGDLDAAMRLGLRGIALGQYPAVVDLTMLTVYRFVNRPDTADRAWQWWDRIDKHLKPRGLTLSRVLRLMATREWTEAAAFAARSREETAAAASVLIMEVFAFLAAGDLAAAARAAEVIDLTKFTKGYGEMHAEPQAWTVALAHAVRGEHTEAWQLLSDGWNLEADDDPIAACVQLWLREPDEPRHVPSTFVPVLPKEITGTSDDVVHPSVFRPETLPMPADTPPHGPAVLALATEWSSAHGGLSTLNRQLCRALAAQGVEVVCVAVTVSDADRRDAESSGIHLRQAVRPPGGTDHAALSGRAAIPEGFVPDYIIGHGRVTGPAAHQLAEHFPSAKRIHVIHMAADEIEWHKLDRMDDAGERSETRHQIELDLAKGAHRAVAIGPRLYDRYLRELSRFDTARVFNLVPGFDAADDRPRTPPPGAPWKILVAGRAEDAQLKGLDIAARALGLAVRDRSPTAARVELLVRGAPQGESESLRQEVLAWARSPALGVVVRPYSADRDSMIGDLETSTLVLMPSRQEGFGLVGLEAITAGVPVLVSGNSGLGDQLRAALDAEHAERVVVPVTGDLDVDAARWSVAITAALFDRDAAFGRAATLRATLAERDPWARGIADLLRDL